MQNQIQNIHKLIPNFMDSLKSARQIKQKNIVHLTAQNTGYVSSANFIANSRSNTKFVIRYQQKQVIARSGHKINRYSSKHQNQVIKQKKISQSFIERTKLKNKDGISLPSYLRPTQASISAQLQRNRIGSLADMHSNQNKVGSVLRLRSKSIEQEDQQERQYNRIPIEFYDQKDYGCGADFVRARVVFRGYAPKNTYYYLKTLKPFKRKPKKINLLPQSSFCIGQQNTSPKNQIASISSLNLAKNQFDIRFQSKFQSGNLSAASRISLNQYWLYMREDTNTHGLRQWYYFVATNKKPLKIKFRIYKFTKSYSLYRWGMKPYIRAALNDVVTQWQQGGEKVKYQFDSNQKCFYIEFEYNFQEQNQEVQFAMLPPYTYSMLKDFIRGLPYQNLQAEQKEPLQLQSFTHLKSEQVNCKNLNLQPKIKQKIKAQVIIIGQSLAGLDLNLIEIRKNFKNQLSNKQREAIIILGRTHPGQTVSNFTIQSFIQTVLSNQDYVQFYDFFIIPMINPDGVYFGNHRTSIIGQDLNRNFNTNDFQVFPEIQAVHNAINKIKKSHKIRFIIDLHGHSARRNIFAYGDQHQMGSPQYLHTRILPKLLNDSISSFKYDFCIFRESKQKKNTARVYYSNKYKINCLTIQQSYGLLQDGPISIRIWKNFGVALAQCLIQFANLFDNGKQKILQQYLSEQIHKQKIQLEKVLQKHKRMLGIVNQQFRSLNTTGMNVINTNIIQRNLSQNIQHNKHKKNIKEQELQEQVQVQVQNQKYTNYDQHYIQKQQTNNKKQQNFQKHSTEQIQQQKQINLSQLSSGDESLQNKNEQIEQIKKQIYRVGCMKQGIKRQKYNIADKKLKLFEQSDQYNNQLPSFRRMHQQKSSMIPRIAKLQLKRKQEYNLSFKRQFREERRDILQKQRQERRKQIQAKFKKMALPSIRK